MGFSSRWVQWMLMCVTSVSYSIYFHGLSLSLKVASNNAVISGCRICPQAPAITHLLFADDSFLFFKASAEEATSVKEILNQYEFFSVQPVNYQKSAIFFSSNVRTDKQAEIKNILQVHNDIGNSKYLGLPSLIGKSKKSVFNYLKDKIWAKVKSWNTKLLSRVGKALLLRNVAQTIPANTMSCFLIPKS
ncbi:uncharacterized protein LOC141685032 [Apium graveolens]|uniref:uncharacterized protein LOC141685032 n=1 Tax=Apium graveolens TaxID=4045 RepID=UPI003D7B5162